MSKLLRGWNHYSCDCGKDFKLQSITGLDKTPRPCAEIFFGGEWCQEMLIAHTFTEDETVKRGCWDNKQTDQ